MKCIKTGIGVTIFTALLILLVGNSPVWAQGTAQISGSVKDQTGAVLPGVEVTATQTGTGTKRAAVTDETGAYNLTNLPIGPYMVEASLPGFKTYVQTGIVLQVGTNPTVNAILEVGQVSDQIEVQADAALVETRASGIGNVIDNQRVLELPLNGRNPTELIFLAGLATQTTDGALNSGIRNYATVVISVGGGMNGGLNYFLDGGTHDDPQNNLNLPLPFPDALQEFKVETSGLSAQYGHHAAGAINAVTKSGTNAFHGDAFEFLRNGSMNARNAFALTNDGIKRNQFGGTIGGPIVKNKLFFFGGEQVTTQRAVPTAKRAYIPTADMLRGDFTTLASPLCNSGAQLTLKAPFVGNKIDPNLFSPQALALVRWKGFPTTSDPCGLTQFGGISNINEYLTVGKVDYQLSEKHSMLVRYMGARKDQPWDYDGKNILTSSQGQINQRAHSLVVGDTYLFGAGAVNSLRVTGLRTLDPRINPIVVDLNDIGVKNVYVPFKGHMQFTVTNYFQISGSGVQPGHYNTVEGQVSDDISVVKGSHQWGFGGYYSHSNFTENSNISAVPTFSFSGQAKTGNAMADFLAGFPSGFSAGSAGLVYPRQNYIAAYAQDAWKATSHLTVNYGVRFEPFIAPYEGHRRTNYFTYDAFNAGYHSPTYPKAPAGLIMQGDPTSTKNGKFFFDRWLHFVPRLGFAWDVNGSGLLVVRAAYGIFTDLPPLWTFHGNGGSAPYNVGGSLTNPSLADPWNQPSGAFPNGYPGGNPLPAFFNKNSNFAVNDSYDNLRQHAKSTYVHQWNLGIQRQVGQNWLLAANYLGNSDIHLWGPQNQLNYAVYTPTATTGNIASRRILTLQNPKEGQYYAGIGELEDGGTGQYNAMLLTVQRRRAKGLTISGNYTWSHCVGDGVVSQPGSGGILATRRRNSRANCTGDRRHVANLSTVVETPQFANTALRALGSGWQVSGILKMQSGGYFTVVSGFDTTLNGTNDNNRANQVLVDPYLPNKSLDGWLNPAAFARPANGNYGNAANSIQGPGRIGIDMGLTRKFQVREGQSVEFRAEAFNIPNHLNPDNPNTTLSSQTFGKSTTAGDPRILQLALKYVF